MGSRQGYIAHPSDQLKQVPDRLEGLIADKKFIQAALLLVKSVKTINKREIGAIGALSELKAYLGSQETVSNESRRSSCVDLDRHLGRGVTQSPIFEDIQQ